MCATVITSMTERESEEIPLATNSKRKKRALYQYGNEETCMILALMLQWFPSCYFSNFSSQIQINKRVRE